MVINDTVYTKNTPFGQSIYKVRTVDILPLDDDTISPTDTSTAKDSENLPKTSTTTEATKDPETNDVNRDDIDRGSPEVLETNNRKNEISPQDIDNVEVPAKLSVLLPDA